MSAIGGKLPLCNDLLLGIYPTSSHLLQTSVPSSFLTSFFPTYTLPGSTSLDADFVSTSSLCSVVVWLLYMPYISFLYASKLLFFSLPLYVSLCYLLFSYFVSQQISLEDLPITFCFRTPLSWDMPPGVLFPDCCILEPGFYSCFVDLSSFRPASHSQVSYAYLSPYPAELHACLFLTLSRSQLGDHCLPEPALALLLCCSSHYNGQPISLVQFPKATQHRSLSLIHGVKFASTILRLHCWPLNVPARIFASGHLFYFAPATYMHLRLPHHSHSQQNQHWLPGFKIHHCNGKHNICLVGNYPHNFCQSPNPQCLSSLSFHLVLSTLMTSLSTYKKSQKYTKTWNNEINTKSYFCLSISFCNVQVFLVVLYLSVALLVLVLLLLLVVLLLLLSLSTITFSAIPCSLVVAAVHVPCILLLILTVC